MLFQTVPKISFIFYISRNYCTSKVCSATLLARPTYWVFFFLVSWGWVRPSALGTSATTWPIVPAPDDRWWVWSSRCNENWQAKPKYSEKTCPSAILYTTNHTWPRDRTWVAAVGSRRLTAWAMAQPYMPFLLILCYNGSLVTWTVVSVTIAMFKPFIFSMSGFTLYIHIHKHTHRHRRMCTQLPKLLCYSKCAITFSLNPQTSESGTHETYRRQYITKQ
jgi:hypothetical protein